jgi:hypothetical protein
MLLFLIVVNQKVRQWSVFQSYNGNITPFENQSQTMNYAQMCMHACARAHRHTHTQNTNTHKAWLDQSLHFSSLGREEARRDTKQEVKYVVETINFIPVNPTASEIHRYCVYCNI